MGTDLAIEVERLVAEVYGCLGHYHPTVYGSPYEGTLHSAPPEASLREFLATTGRDLPPSYRAFLQAHNGWSDYVAGFTLVGVDGRHTTEARQDIRETLEIVAEAWAGVDAVPASGRAVGTTEDHGAAVVEMIPFGTDFNGALLLFDPKTGRADGELEVVLHDTSGPSKRYRGFVEMLMEDREEVCRPGREEHSEGGAP